LKANPLDGTTPTLSWLHLGAGNIFRIFLAALQQDLIDAELTDSGLAVCECFDEEIIPTVFAPYDNKVMAVTLHADGRIEKRGITSIAEAFGRDTERLAEVVSHPGLQMVSLTITEKGYAVTLERTAVRLENAETTLECLTAALYARFLAGSEPLALVAMDNFAANGDVLKKAITTIAGVWHNNGSVPETFVSYVSTLAYPWTMIDKITPHPSEAVAKMLAEEGFTHTTVTKTKKGTFIAPFVNAEASQYLVMEDHFPNGKPAFEQLKKSGVYLTDRETVRKVDHMKVCACLNPLHTILGVCGMLLGYPTIAACMRDPRLVAFVRKAASEALPAVAHPGIIDPQAFLEEVITVRFPNPFIPDTPTRIVTDCSQKIPIRFGQTLKALFGTGVDGAGIGETGVDGTGGERGLRSLEGEVARCNPLSPPLPSFRTVPSPEAIPLLIALWLRYRMGWADDGTRLTLAPDPLVPDKIAALEGLSFGTAINLGEILNDGKQFGVDLYEVGLGERIEGLFAELSEGVGAVSGMLNRQG